MLTSPRARAAAVVGVAALCVCMAVVSLHFWLANGEVQEHRYSTYDEARPSLPRGWLPATLPPSATEIHEWHDMDTNVSVGSFRFDPAERSRLLTGLHAGWRRPIRIDRDPSFSSRLPRDSSVDQLTSAGFELYSGEVFDFAIDWAAGVAYFWSSPR